MDSNLNKIIMKNWKTTLTGVAVIIAGCALIYVGQAAVGGTVILIGLGLVSAKDSNVTGGTTQQ